MDRQLPAGALVLDLKNLIYIDSSGANALRDLTHSCQRQGIRLILCGLTHQPLDIARRSGLLALLPASDVCPDLASGLAAAAGA